MRIYVLNFHKHRRLLSGLKIISVCLAVFLMFALIANAQTSNDYTSVMAEQNSKRVIVIDAGHGGEDPGAVGKNGMLEKDLNMQIVLEVGNSLTEEGYAVVYTRTEDTPLDKMVVATH